MYSIVFKRVSKSFRRRAEVGASKGRRESRRVLVDVSFEVDEGQIACVLGKNGSGKTTLVRIASTLIEPDGGAVSICGFDSVAESGEVKRRVGVILNAGEGGFHPRLSGLSNLEYYAALYKIPLRDARTRIRRILSELGIEDRGGDQYQSYSSGMRRRLALAKALMPDSPVLLLDEPTLGVDPWSAEEIRARLTWLSEQGKSILFTTNDLAEARSLADNVYRIERGTLSSVPEIEDLVAS